MPAVIQPNIVGQREIIDDEVFLAKAEEYPFISMVPKGGKLKAMSHKHQLAKRTAGHRRGIADGAPAGDRQVKHERRKLLDSNLQYFREEYSVGQIAYHVSDVAGRKDLLGTEIDYAMDKVMRNMERNSLDEVDQQDDDGVAGSEIRGMGALISSTFADLEAEWRTPAASIYTGASLANFGEDDFVTILASMWKTRGKRTTLYGMCGIDFCEHIGSWSTYQPDKTSHGRVKSFNVDNKDFEYTQRIDVLNFASARVELHPNAHIFMARTAADTDEPSTQGNRSCYLFDWEGVKWKWGLNPERRKLEDDGSGPHGYIHAIGQLGGDPRFHGKITPNA